MSGRIRVTPAELQEMSNRYGQKSGEVENIIGDLDKMIQQLQGSWEGQSSQAFASQYERLKPSFKQMQQLLDEIKVQLSKTAGALEQADQEIANQING